VISLKQNDCVLALDIGGSKIMCGAVTADGEIRRAVKTALPSKYGVGELSAAIFSLTEDIASEFRCAACGVAIPGLADAGSGTWVYAPYSGISDFKIARVLSGRLSMPVFIENDVNACAVGERRFGACRGVDDFLWITVSNGIGGSVFCRGELYTGCCGNAGEIGHFKVVPGGRLCGCGARGCLEAEAAGPAISDKFYELTGIRASAKDIAERAKNGDGNAKSVYEKAGYLIGLAAGNAANLINPAKVIFGGGVSTDFELLRPGLEKGVAETLFAAANKAVAFEKTALGYNAALVGAAALAL
jgi:glucokinase